MKTRGLSQLRLKQLLNYDKATGSFTRLDSGSVVGTLSSDGYIRVRVDGVLHLAHRLAWLYIHGSHPTKLLDHINENRSDNRQENLREATHSQNYQNMTKPHVRSVSGYLGVSWHIAGKRWAAEICVNRKRTKLGLFNTPAEAHAAYLDAKSKIHPFAANAVPTRKPA